MIWAELLELNEIGIDEDVFALGADSLTVTQMLSRLRARFGIDFSLRDILMHRRLRLSRLALSHRKAFVHAP